MDYSETREYYDHDADCRPEDLSPIFERAGKKFRGCSACSGVFKEDGKTGVAVTSLIFDKDHASNIVIGED